MQRRMTTVRSASSSGGGDDQILLTIEEAAKLLRIGRTTMYELMWARKIEAGPYRPPDPVHAVHRSSTS